jgi:hypothetical protein
VVYELEYAAMFQVHFQLFNNATAEILKPRVYHKNLLIGNDYKSSELNGLNKV